jgi:exosortase/archaeosortase family protein
MSFRFSSASVRTGVAAAVVAGAVHLAQSRDVVVDFTRPLVLGTLRWFGNEAVDCGEELRVGKLLVPWTRDCAGINLLFILLALAVWVNRKESRAWRFWLCMLGMVPAAAVANVLRVLTLLMYRTVAYPGVESPQTHYFIGFIWLVPFISLITPRDGRALRAGLMETLHAAAVVALLAPMAGTPNALLLTLAAVVGLAQCRVRDDAVRANAWPLVAWVTAGVGIAVVGMESFWLPWLLLCPLLVQSRWIWSVPGLACVLCTNSLVVMQPWSWAVAAAGVAWVLFYGEGAEETAGDKGAASDLKDRSAVPPTIYECAAADADAALRGEAAAASEHDAAACAADAYTAVPLVPVCVRPRRLGWAVQLAFYACLTFPFLASTVLAIGQKSWEPPAGVMARCISPNCFEVRLHGQPKEIGLACYSSASRDRHHTLEVCLKYRGIELSAVEDCPLVMTDGKHWFREFFMQEGQMLADYPAYVRSTFVPWRDPGVHLIFVSANEAHSAAEFNAASEVLAQRFFEECAGATDARVAVVKR